MSMSHITQGPYSRPSGYRGSQPIICAPDHCITGEFSSAADSTQLDRPARGNVVGWRQFASAHLTDCSLGLGSKKERHRNRTPGGKQNQQEGTV